MMLEIGNKVNYLHQGIPLKCSVKRTIEYGNRLYIVLEPEEITIKREIMVPEDQIEELIRKIEE